MANVLREIHFTTTIFLIITMYTSYWEKKYEYDEAI